MPSRRNFAYGGEDVKKAPMICFRCWLTFLQWTIFQASLQAPFWTTSTAAVALLSSVLRRRRCQRIWLDSKSLWMRVNRFNWSRTGTIGRIVVWQDTALAVQQTATVVVLASICFQEYSLLSDKATIVLLPFSTTYLCEGAFSAVTAMKTKYRSRLDIEHEIRICLSRIPPCLDKLCSAEQAQPSHWTENCVTDIPVE